MIVGYKLKKMILACELNFLFVLNNLQGHKPYIEFWMIWKFFHLYKTLFPLNEILGS